MANQPPLSQLLPGKALVVALGEMESVSDKVALIIKELVHVLVNWLSHLLTLLCLASCRTYSLGNTGDAVCIKGLMGVLWRTKITVKFVEKMKNTQLGKRTKLPII